MHRMITLTLLGTVLFVYGCTAAPKPTKVKGPEKIPSRLEVGRQATGEVVVGMPITLPGLDHAMLPVTLEHFKGWFEPDTHHGQSAGESMKHVSSANHFFSYGSSNRNVHWHNVIFHDLKSDQTRTLLSHTALISGYQLLGKAPETKEDTYRADCLVFSISDTDTNGDGVIDTDDAVIAYVSDVDGKNPHAVTPQGSKLTHLKYLPDYKLIYLVVIEDTTGDGRFTTHDKRRLLQYRVGSGRTSPGRAQPVLKNGEVSNVRRILRID